MFRMAHECTAAPRPKPAPWLVLALFAVAMLAAGEPRVLRHVIVYHEPGRFGGWPANHGIWSWGDEILVGFSAAYFKFTSPDRHPYDRTKPEVPTLARSLDGGETWSIETPSELRPPTQGGSLQELTEPMEFTNPGFAMKLWFGDASKGPSWLWYSTDRGRNWRGPFSVPDFGQPAVAARTDYIVNGKHDALLFLTAAKRNGREGRVFCARTTDGGLHWKFVAWIGDEPARFSIMPSSVRLSPSEIVTATRVKQDQQTSSIDLYASTDNAATWVLRSTATSSTGAFSGNPPSMIRLRDGRLALTYGVRDAPFGIRARLSSDGGRTWSKEFVLRDDAAAWDCGYTRSAQRPDGNIVTVYYFPDKPRGERMIGATIWDPGKD
jgi:hypothetical protein